MRNEIENLINIEDLIKKENLIKKVALRDVEIALKESLREGFIIPDLVFEILKEVEKTYEVTK